MTLTCYYLDDSPADPRLPHDSGRPVDYSQVLALGVEHWHIPVSSEGKYEEVDSIMEQRGYHYRDFVTLNKETLGDTLESVLDGFYQEHMHEFEEARYILTGHGYWDIREHPTETWIRFKVGPGDLVILPPGMFHRFTLDEKTDLSSMRMFLETPSRHALPRGEIADTNPYRIDYLRNIAAH
ncbi:1,2-dihydroxy-3-keto-5-methylthiopentene dioxygenase [Pisolithus marmoratus]|nr:1,2-dihydroxy-3-keto-5-methylthiopentene dioxygenase [Pisolithus marmoratus]